jgi:hypothetical protein
MVGAGRIQVFQGVETALAHFDLGFVALRPRRAIASRGRLSSSPVIRGKATSPPALP